VLFEHADAAVHGLGARARWDLGACRCASVTALKRSMRLAKSCSRLGSAPLCCVHPAHGVQTGQGGHAARAVACEHAGQCAAWVVGRGGRGLQRVASGAFPQLNSIVCTRQFSPGDVGPGRVGLVLAMSFERTGLPCADPLSPASAHSLSLTVGEVLVECVCTLACRDLVFRPTPDCCCHTGVHGEVFFRFPGVLKARTRGASGGCVGVAASRASPVLFHLQRWWCVQWLMQDVWYVLSHRHVGVSSVVCFAGSASRSHVHSSWRGIVRHGFHVLSLLKAEGPGFDRVGEPPYEWDCLMRVVPC
jgi:hypothetical protein